MPGRNFRLSQSLGKRQSRRRNYRSRSQTQSIGNRSRSRSRSRSLGNRSRSLGNNRRKSQKSPITILNTKGVNAPASNIRASPIKPKLVEPENLVPNEFYYIKYSGLHRSEYSSMFAGVYKGIGSKSPSREPKLVFTNVWRMVPEYLRERYTMWVKLDWESKFDGDDYKFYSSPSKYSKWESVQNQLARDSKLKDVMVYNTYKKVFGEGNHPRNLVNETLGTNY